jgi:hypothetical protein
MFDIPVQAVLITFLRRTAQATYAYESAALRYYYGFRLLGIRDHLERRAVGQTYRQAKAALVIDLAREVSRPSL